VILYHFTPMARVEAIQREGLRAKPHGTLDGSTILGTFNKPAVYLTDKPTTAETDAGIELYRMELNRHLPTEVTIVSKRWLQSQDNEPLARFTLRLPSHDRKLKQYGRWLRANHHRIDGLPDPDDDHPHVRRVMTEWWLYFGDIPPSALVQTAGSGPL
jgi:hypothetical protein